MGGDKAVCRAAASVKLPSEPMQPDSSSAAVMPWGETGMGRERPFFDEMSAHLKAQDGDDGMGRFCDLTGRSRVCCVCRYRGSRGSGSKCM